MNQANNSSNNSPNKAAPKPQGSNRNNNNRRRYRNNGNKPHNPNTAKPATPSAPSTPIERQVEKYINLLDQHLIARKKFHDLYYRADDNQIIKLEKNFYSTLNDMRDFEARIPEELKAPFEKKINGLSLDLTYSSNHQIDINEKINLDKVKIEDPHFLQSQAKADYANDTEESMGTIEDYSKYKMI